jgi:hypothetical protein
MRILDHAYKQEWIISGDRMWAPKGKGFMNVLKNDENILVASFEIWRDGSDRNAHYTTHYVVIEKHAGTVVELDDVVVSAVADLPPAAREGATPMIHVGHCVSDPRPTPPPPTMPPLASIGSTTEPSVSPTPQPSTTAPLSLEPPTPRPERPTVSTLLERQNAEQKQKVDHIGELFRPLAQCVKQRAHSSDLYSSAESADVVARAAVGFCSKEEANYRAALWDLKLVMTDFDAAGQARDAHEKLVDMALTIVVGERQHLRQ